MIVHQNSRMLKQYETIPYHTGLLFIVSELLEVDVCVHALRRECDDVMSDDTFHRWTHISDLMHCSCEQDTGRLQTSASLIIKPDRSD